jgi:peptide chain release factor 2
MLLSMYEKWAVRSGQFSCKVVDVSPGEHSGIKNAELEIIGTNAFGYLSGEKGTHRLVRLSPFNSEGKRMTSFAGVEIMPIFEEAELEMVIPPSDIQFSSMRCGGAGGQVFD